MASPESLYWIPQIAALVNCVASLLIFVIGISSKKLRSQRHYPLILRTSIFNAVAFIIYYFYLNGNRDGSSFILILYLNLIMLFSVLMVVDTVWPSELIRTHNTVICFLMFIAVGVALLLNVSYCEHKYVSKFVICVTVPAYLFAAVAGCCKTESNLNEKPKKALCFIIAGLNIFTWATAVIYQDYVVVPNVYEVFWSYLWITAISIHATEFFAIFVLDKNFRERTLRLLTCGCCRNNESEVTHNDISSIYGKLIANNQLNSELHYEVLKNDVEKC